MSPFVRGRREIEAESESWSRKKNINLSEIFTPHPPLTSQQLPGHFTHVWEKIYSRVSFECYIILSTAKYEHENIQHLNKRDDGLKVRIMLL